MTEHEIKQFEEIMEKYKKEIFNYCFQKLSHSKWITEEVVDDVFAHLFSKWDHLVIGKDIRAYLYRTADLMIKARLRKERRYYNHHFSLEESEESIPQKQYSESDTYCEIEIPSYNADDFFELPYMNKFKESLSPQDQILYELRFEKHLPLMEVAEIVGMPYSTARLRLLSISDKTEPEFTKCSSECLLIKTLLVITLQSAYLRFRHEPEIGRPPVALRARSPHSERSRTNCGNSIHS